MKPPEEKREDPRERGATGVPNGSGVVAVAAAL